MKLQLKIIWNNKQIGYPCKHNNSDTKLMQTLVNIGRIKVVKGEIDWKIMVEIKIGSKDFNFE